MHKLSIVIIASLSDKKNKTIGNKSMHKLNKKNSIIDEHISMFNKLFYSPKIVVVASDDNKKLKKHIEDKYKKILYIDHPMDKHTNIGYSIHKALDYVMGGCLIINVNTLLKNSITLKTKIKNSTKNTFVGALNNSNRNVDIGYIINNDGSIGHSYYGLPNPMLDLLFIHKKDIQIFKEQVMSNAQTHKKYLFEIINDCIDKNISIKPLILKDKDITFTSGVTMGTKYNNV